MLLSLTRIGATRQHLEKSVTISGADPAEVARRAARVGQFQPIPGTPGLLAVRLPSHWLGTRAAREHAFSSLAAAISQLASAAASLGGTVLPTGIGLAGQPAVLGGDRHVLDVLSPVEQEVLSNLLRVHVPALIALTGRCVTVAGMPRDRIGSRWLAGSRSHLATRFVASTTPEHLDRVKAELRRRDGVARLDRMDVLPDQAADGSPVVVVRCLDAAASLAAARAHAIVLAALALRARRLVREGRRTGNAPQRLLEENRAKAVADGLRARFAVPDQSWPGRQRQTAVLPQVGARNAVRTLLLGLCPEFANLDVTVAELAPVILPVELPSFGLRGVSTEGDWLAAAAAEGEAALVRAAGAALTDTTLGGPLLRQASGAAPGRVSVVLDLWHAHLAQTVHRNNRGGRGGRE